MFTVSTIQNTKNASVLKKNSLKKKSPILISSPMKTEEKQSTTINTISLQTNISSESGKGCSFNSFTQEQNISENIQENDFLGKKTKFQVNFVDMEKEKKIFEEKKTIIKEKKNKKKKNEILSEIENEKTNEGRWNYDEHLRFIEAINKFGNDWKEVQKYVGTRSSNQVRSHAQKFILKLKTFKDSSIGIDLTDNSVKNLTDIIKKIKEVEENNKNSNILLLLSQKLSERNLKSNEETYNLYKKEKNKEVIKSKKGNDNNENIDNNNDNINLKFNKKEINEENIQIKKNNNDINKNINNNFEVNINTIINNEKKNINFKNEKIDNNINRQNNNINENICFDKNENKEILELGEKGYYFDYDNKENNIGNNYEVINDFIYETNNPLNISFLNYYNTKELNTLSMFNREYYS